MNGSQAEQTWDIRHVQGCREAWAAAFFIWLHPVFLFYAHLFYTDTSSVFWLLLSWNLSLRNDMMGSAVAGLFSSLTRQTNMIWHAYIVFDSLIHTFLQCKRTTNRLMIDIMNQFPRLLYQNWAHVIVGVIYASFLFVNGGVAIGDKSHHQVSLHYAMLPYFLGFHALSYAPLQLLHPRHLAEDIRLLLRPAHGFLLPFASACAGLCAMVMATGDAAHAFILADNRHFTFYIYRRWLLRSELRRVILVPLYAWGVVSPFLELVNGNSASASNGNGDERRKLMYHVSDVVLLLCAGATLIPSPLLEPRYFVVAHMLLCMQRMSRLQRHCAWKLGWLSTGLITANVALVYVFAEMPFERRPDAHMPSDDSPGRFMF